MNKKALMIGMGILCLLCSLLGGFSEAADVTLLWDPSPSTVDGYKVYYKTGTSGAPYTDTITLGNVTSTTVTGLTEGLTYFFAVSAYAGTTESTYSNEVSLTIPSSDTTAPAVTISNPTSGTTYSTVTTPVTLAGTASDAVGVTQVTWSNDRGGSGTCTGTTSWTCSNITLQSGANVLTIRARDAANNAGTDTLTVTYTPPDTTAPAVTISNPTSGTTYSTGTTPITLAGTASDAVGVTQVTWSSDRGGSGTCTGTTSWTCSNITLQSGANVLTVRARDAANNAGTDTLTVTYYLPPVADFSGDVTSGDPALTVNFTDLSTGNITSRLWNFGDGQTSTGTNPTHIYTVPGIYTVSLTVTGPGGEHTKSVTNYVRVNLPPPENLRLSSGS